MANIFLEQVRKDGAHVFVITPKTVDIGYSVLGMIQYFASSSIEQT